MELVDIIFDTLSDEVKNGVGEILTADEKDFKIDDVNPNLILSEIF